MTDGELLKYAIENGMINAALVQEKIEMQRRKELLEKHPFKIWNGSDGLWNTYLPDEDKGRIRKRKRTREELEDTIIEFWEKELDNPSIKDVLDRWTSDKLKYSEICQGTYDRYLRDFKRFFAYAIPGNLSLLTKDEK